MKAFLLAAGHGTRLRPFTLHTPKCLVPVNGKPLLGIWLESLHQLGVREVLINTHHLAEKVFEFVHSLSTPLRVHLAHESELLGSAGTLVRNRWFVETEAFFWIIYADNLTTANLGTLLQFHKETDSFLTLGLFQTETPSQCGIVTLDAEGRIVDFIEKPSDPRGNLANAGIMLASPSLLDQIPQRRPCDLALDVLPNLVGKIHGVEPGMKGIRRCKFFHLAL